MAVSCKEKEGRDAFVPLAGSWVCCGEICQMEPCNQQFKQVAEVSHLRYLQKVFRHIRLAGALEILKANP